MSLVSVDRTSVIGAVQPYAGLLAVGATTLGFGFAVELWVGECALVDADDWALFDWRDAGLHWSWIGDVSRVAETARIRGPDVTGVSPASRAARIRPRHTSKRPQAALSRHRETWSGTRRGASGHRRGGR